VIADLAPSPFCLGGVCITWVALLYVAGLVLLTVGFIVWALVRNAGHPRCVTCGHRYGDHEMSSGTRSMRCLKDGCACAAYEAAVRRGSGALDGEKPP
jgi:hypothetical protein